MEILKIQSPNGHYRQTETLFIVLVALNFFTYASLIVRNPDILKVLGERFSKNGSVVVAPSPTLIPKPTTTPTPTPKPVLKTTPKKTPVYYPKATPKPVVATITKRVADGNYLLALVTKQTTLGQYVPSDLVDLSSLGFGGKKLRKPAYDALVRLLGDARNQGIRLNIVSTYRSYSTQQSLFNSYARQYGEASASTFSARPGQSEHQLGTTIDFDTIPGTGLDQSFAFTAEGAWLKSNAYKYGFALSYPSGSQSVTGYIYEPWHWRFIGQESALEWKNSSLVLCRYLEGKIQTFL